MAFCLSLVLKGARSRFESARAPLLSRCYLTGELKLASPRFASAHAHQMITLETFFTYPGRTISFWYLSPIKAFFFSLSSCYIWPSESTTCQWGSGVSGTTKSSDSVRTLLPSFVLCVTLPLLAFGPWNCDEVWEPPCAKALEMLKPRAATTRATTVTLRMRDIFIDEPLFEFHAHSRN